MWCINCMHKKFACVTDIMPSFILGDLSCHRALLGPQRYSLHNEPMLIFPCIFSYWHPVKLHCCSQHHGTLMSLWDTLSVPSRRCVTYADKSQRPETCPQLECLTHKIMRLPVAIGLRLLFPSIYSYWIAVRPPLVLPTPWTLMPQWHAGLMKANKLEIRP